MNRTTITGDGVKSGFPTWLKSVLGITVFGILMTAIAMGSGLFDSKKIDAAQPRPVDMPPDERAKLAFRTGNWPLLEGSYREMLKADQFDSNAMFYLAYSLHKQEKLNEAIPYYERATEFYRYRRVGLYNLACIYAEQEKPDDAIRYLDQSISSGFITKDGIDGGTTGETDFEILKDDPEFHRLILLETVNRAKQGRKKRRR